MTLIVVARIGAWPDRPGLPKRFVHSLPESKRTGPPVGGQAHSTTRPRAARAAGAGGPRDAMTDDDESLQSQLTEWSGVSEFLALFSRLFFLEFRLKQNYILRSSPFSRCSPAVIL
jgi:hypothetical protein